MKIPEHWTFKSQEVASFFDSHVREQLPWYDLASEAVVHFIRHYLPEQGLLYDIGASTGNFYKRLEEIIEKREASYVGIDNSQEMVDQWRENNFADTFDDNVEIILSDAQDFEYQPYDCAILFLVLMFIPYSQRKDFIVRLWDKCNQGGVMLIVDKEEQPKGYYGTALHRLTLQGKLNMGVNYKEIIEKEMSLQGVQRPMKYLDTLAGLQPRVFFKYGEFFGALVEKGDF